LNLLEIMTTQNSEQEFRITRGSGNIFADLGFADAAGRQAKLRLAYVVNQLLEKPRSRKAGRITVLTAYRRTLP